MKWRWKKCSIVGGGAVTTLGFTLGQNDINASTLQNVLNVYPKIETTSGAGFYHESMFLCEGMKLWENYCRRFPSGYDITLFEGEQ